ncbi:MAG: peptidylprolyl isomerase, partial [Acetobacteraceae bacterium]
MRRRTMLVAAMGGAVLATEAHAATEDLENTLYMYLKYGRVVIVLRPDLAPKAVAQVKKLVRMHFYDGTPFWRVIAGFMAQGG